MQQSPMSGTASGAVYVQTNAAPNEVIVLGRADDGSLDRIGSVATGGDGDGTPHLTSQGSVVLTGDGRHLLVTNAATGDLSVFSVASDGSIELRERVHTGPTPRSVAERDGLLVVLNTGSRPWCHTEWMLTVLRRWRTEIRRWRRATQTPPRSPSAPTDRWS